MNDCEEHADCGDGGWWTGPQPGQNIFGWSAGGGDPLGCGWADVGAVTVPLNGGYWTRQVVSSPSF